MCEHEHVKVVGHIVGQDRLVGLCLDCDEYVVEVEEQESEYVPA